MRIALLVDSVDKDPGLALGLLDNQSAGGIVEVVFNQAIVGFQNPGKAILPVVLETSVTLAGQVAPSVVTEGKSSGHLFRVDPRQGPGTGFTGGVAVFLAASLGASDAYRAGRPLRMKWVVVCKKHISFAQQVTRRVVFVAFISVRSMRTHEAVYFIVGKLLAGAGHEVIQPHDVIGCIECKYQFLEAVTVTFLCFGRHHSAQRIIGVVRDDAIAEPETSYAVFGVVFKLVSEQITVSINNRCNVTAGIVAVVDNETVRVNHTENPVQRVETEPGDVGAIADSATLFNDVATLVVNKPRNSRLVLNLDDPADSVDGIRSTIAETLNRSVRQSFFQKVAGRRIGQDHAFAVRSNLLYKASLTVIDILEATGIRVFKPRPTPQHVVADPCLITQSVDNLRHAPQHIVFIANLLFDPVDDLLDPAQISIRRIRIQRSITSSIFDIDAEPPELEFSCLTQLVLDFNRAPQGVAIRCNKGRRIANKKR